MVALLRGINVGTSKRVAMADLRRVLTDLGYTDVSTVLNSGNALFRCTPPAARRAATDIEAGVRAASDVDCRVVTRTMTEFTAALDQAPLLDLMADPSRYFVGFLDGPPSSPGRRAVTEVDAAQAGGDRVQLVGRELYLWCPAGLSASPLGKTNWDRTLGAAVTLRNWKTARRLADAL